MYSIELKGFPIERGRAYGESLPCQIQKTILVASRQASETVFKTYAFQGKHGMEEKEKQL